MRNEKDALKHPTHTLFCLPKPYSTRTFLFLVKGCLFPLIEDSIYKRRSTEDTQIALTDTIYEKVRQWNFLSSRHTLFALKPFFFRRGGRAVIYVITVFVGRCSGRALSFLCLIPSYQTRRTSYQPVKGCERLNQVRRMNLYLCTEVAGRRPLNCSSAMQW